MTRCQSCDGILTKNEEACYRCGDPVPENAKWRNPSWPGVLTPQGRIHWRRPPVHPRFSLAILRRTIHSDNCT